MLKLLYALGLRYILVSSMLCYICCKFLCCVKIAVGFCDVLHYWKFLCCVTFAVSFCTVLKLLKAFVLCYIYCKFSCSVTFSVAFVLG